MTTSVSQCCVWGLCFPMHSSLPSQGTQARYAISFLFLALISSCLVSGDFQGYRKDHLNERGNRKDHMHEQGYRKDHMNEQGYRKDHMNEQGYRKDHMNEQGYNEQGIKHQVAYFFFSFLAFLGRSFFVVVFIQGLLLLTKPETETETWRLFAFFFAFFFAFS